MELCNLTPLAAERVVTAGVDGRDLLLVVVKGTYDAAGARGQAPMLALEQAPVQLADEYYEDPESSSLAAPSDMAPEKVGADVLVVGHAERPSSGEPFTDVHLSFDRLQKVVRVHTDRDWTRGLLGVGPSNPKPFVKVPLRYERAFGGLDPTTGARFDHNPVGRGFVDQGSRHDVTGEAAPNLELPRSPVKAPGPLGIPAGFGAVAPSWPSRRQYAGTYDARWEAEVSPFLPDDFDPRFFSVAPPDQILPHPIAGGELVSVVGYSARKQFQCQVPVYRPHVSVLLAGQVLELPTSCDTAVIDLDADTLSLVWRARLDVQDKLHDLTWIRVGDDAGGTP